ncbi:hypothetical protein JB92DRAFT_3004296 [Gautieria morchelliformis]|nr:hypothetical protein JB92DRAFT_3004296 [Gautieria morchelliformis]
MGGEGPYVRFDPQSRAFWASHTGIAALDDEELEAAYSRAYQFIVQSKEILVKEHSWDEAVAEDGKIFSLIPQERRGSGFNISLPSTFSSFMEATNLQMWKTVFEAFDARRPSRSNNDLFISGPTPLSDIFYLLQCMAPGMLLLVRIDEYDEVGEKESVRALPRESWVVSHADVLNTILGGIGAYKALLDASRDRSKSFKESWISHWEPYADVEDRELDYTACGLECGYCGHCDYNDPYDYDD